LLAGAGLAIHSFRNLLDVDLGIRTDHILTFYLQVPDSRSKDPGQIISYYRRMVAAIQALQGVSHVAVATGRPLEGSGFGMPFIVAGKSGVVDPSQRPSTGFGSGKSLNLSPQTCQWYKWASAAPRMFGAGSEETLLHAFVEVFRGETNTFRGRVFDPVGIVDACR
jgi:hypothetical protein